MKCILVVDDSITNLKSAESLRWLCFFDVSLCFGAESAKKNPYYAKSCCILGGMTI